MGAAILHPSDQTLHAYALGTLDDVAADSVGSHLEECPDCRRRVSEVSGDSFLGRLRDARPQPGSSLTEGRSVGASKGAVSRPAVATPDEAVPRELAEHPQYEIKKELGRGGMGVVYLAHNRDMDRLEVLKILNQELLARRGALLERFLREIRTAGKLNHSNVVHAYSTFEVGRLRVFAMEYVEGEDLAALVKKRGPLPVNLSCHFITQAALGMQHAHEAGMVHRDIKPGNLMVSRQGQKLVVKVLDFGLAKALREAPVDGAKTQEGQALGTPDYNAPEQIINASKADIRADIYSLGCTLYYLLTGKPPFQGASLYDVYQAHISTDAKPLNLIRPEVPVELATVVGKMMAKEPGRRYQTPAEVAEALKPFWKPGAVLAPSPVTSQSVVAPATAPATRPATVAPQAEARWASLIDISERDHSKESKPTSALSELTEGRPPWLWAALSVGVLLLGFFAVWASGVLKVKTPDGMIVLENVPKGAEILVDGNKITFTWPGIHEPVEVQAVPGQRKIEVKKGGFKAFGQVVTVKSDETEEVTVRLEPLVAKRPEPKRDDLSEEKAKILPETDPDPWPEALTLAGQPLPFQDRFLAMSRDCRRVATVTVSNHDLRVFEAHDVSKTIEIGKNHPYVWCAAFSPDGKSLASDGGDDGVKIWDSETGTEVRKVQGGAVFLAFSPDGKRLAGCDVGIRSVHVWDVATGEIVATLGTHSNWPTRVAFSPDGKRIASGSGRGFGPSLPVIGELKIWDLETGTCLDLEGHALEVYGVAFSPDGKRLASASVDKTVKVWDLATKKCLVTFDKYQVAQWSARFSPDGLLIASVGSENIVRVWDSTTGLEVTSLFGLPTGTHFVQFSSEGRWIYSGASSRLKAWKAPTGISPQPAGGFAASPDSSSITNVATEGKNAGEERDDNALKLKLCWCPPGSFRMGSPPDEPERQNDEGPVNVTLSRRFWLGKYEVTQSQWRTVMGTTLAEQMEKSETKWQGLKGESPDHPMYYVNYTEARNSRPLERGSSLLAHFDTDRMMYHHRDVGEGLEVQVAEARTSPIRQSSTSFES